MSENKSQLESAYDPWQHSMLMYCSYKGDSFLWNEWRMENLAEKIHLEGADFKRANLQGANLGLANLRDAQFNAACLEGAILTAAQLERAEFIVTRLKGAKINVACLEGAKFDHAKIHSTALTMAQVDGTTVFTGCEFDEKTDFTGVGLDAAIIDPGLKAALKDNIRRIHWQSWIDAERKYGKHLVPWLVERFWKVTDFGSSTKRIIKTFFVLALAFAGLYWLIVLPALLFPQWQGIIKDLWQGEGWIGLVQTFFRAVYFSIVTMTTLGFGDMYAAECGFWASFFGNIFLSIQVLLGYVLLGALITRLGILFIGEAPAAAPSSAKAKANKDD